MTTLKTPLNFFIKTVVCTALASILSWAPCGFVVPAQADGTEKTFAVVPFETLGVGSESGCAKRALFAINDEAEWQRVWGVHTQNIADAQSLPKVDFLRQTVIAVLSGERSDGKSLQVGQVVRGTQETVVYFLLSDEKSWLGVAETQTKNDEPQTVRPYVFVAVDKVNSPLRFADIYGAQNICSKCAG